MLTFNCAAACWWFLWCGVSCAVVQGTLYPDVIESCPPPGSGQKHSHTIKSHHNVGGLPKDLQFKLIEPFRELFKDEVGGTGGREGRQARGGGGGRRLGDKQRGYKGCMGRLDRTLAKETGMLIVP
jgi:hypothetical protein